MTHWTLLSYLEVSLLMLVTVLSAAAITFFDSILEPFLQASSLRLYKLASGRHSYLVSSPQPLINHLHINVSEVDHCIAG